MAETKTENIDKDINNIVNSHDNKLLNYLIGSNYPLDKLISAIDDIKLLVRNNNYDSVKLLLQKQLEQYNLKKYINETKMRLHNLKHKLEQEFVDMIDKITYYNSDSDSKTIINKKLIFTTYEIIISNINVTLKYIGDDECNGSWSLCCENIISNTSASKTHYSDRPLRDYDEEENTKLILQSIQSKLNISEKITTDKILYFILFVMNVGTIKLYKTVYSFI